VPLLGGSGLFHLLGDPILHFFRDGRHQYCKSVGFKSDAARVSDIGLQEVDVVLPQHQKVFNAGHILVDTIVDAEEQLARHLMRQIAELIEVHAVLVLLE